MTENVKETYGGYLVGSPCHHPAWNKKNYTTVDPKQFVLFMLFTSKLELATSRAGRQRIAYRAGGHILRKN